MRTRRKLFQDVELEAAPVVRSSILSKLAHRLVPLMFAASFGAAFLLAASAMREHPAAASARATENARVFVIDPEAASAGETRAGRGAISR